MADCGGRVGEQIEACRLLEEAVLLRDMADFWLTPTEEAKAWRVKSGEFAKQASDLWNAGGRK